MNARTRGKGTGAAQDGACDAPCVDEVKVVRVRAAMKSPEKLAALAETFKVLGDPTRVRIAWALSREELCVCDLSALLGMSQSAVSHSLRALKDLRLVRHRKEGRIAYYALDDEHIAQLLHQGLQHVEEEA